MAALRGSRYSPYYILYLLSVLCILFVPEPYPRLVGRIELGDIGGNILWIRHALYPAAALEDPLCHCACAVGNDAQRILHHVDIVDAYPVRPRIA